MGVDILIPLLGRPHRIEPVLRSALGAAPSAYVLFLCSPSDKASIEVCEGLADADYVVMPSGPDYGDYAWKINTGYPMGQNEFFFTGADDLNFHDGWLQRAMAKMKPGVNVVGTNDLCSPRVLAGEHATHMLVRRSYAETQGTIDEPGKFFHEGYWHEFVDDEAVQTAQYRGCFDIALDSVVEHLHPDAHKAPRDRIYKMQQQRMIYGRRLYKRRKHLWGM